jgi:hypothetical protein
MLSLLISANTGRRRNSNGHSLTGIIIEKAFFANMMMIALY